MKKLRMINVQAAIFPNELISRPDTLYYKILSELNDIVDQAPIVNNIPEDAPAEIPRVVGSSKDNKFQINVSRNRIDLFINFTEEDADNDKNYSLFKSLTNLLCTQVSSAVGISRVGIITTSVSLDEELKEIFVDTWISSAFRILVLKTSIFANAIVSIKFIRS